MSLVLRSVNHFTVAAGGDCYCLALSEPNYLLERSPGAQTLGFFLLLPETDCASGAFHFQESPLMTGIPRVYVCAQRSGFESSC